MIKTIKKIHLWLSLPFGLFITILCVSGATLAFEREITECLHPEVYTVDPQGRQPLPLGQLRQCVQETLPDSVDIVGVDITSDPQRVYEFTFSGARSAAVCVDPYTGKVTGRSERLPFFLRMFQLHRWLLGPSSGNNGRLPIGKLWVGLTTIALLIIVLTGLLLWLSNRHKPLLQSLRISIGKGWPRFWHDLHVAGGIYTAVFVLTLGATGLTWSFTGYRSAVYALLGASTGGGAKTHGELAGTRAQGRPQPADSAAAEGHTESVPEAYIWQQVYDTLAATHPHFRLISLRDGQAGVVPSGRNNLRATDDYEVDTRTGSLISVTPYAERDKAKLLRGTIYMLHTGAWGGSVTRILTFLAILLTATHPLTGYYLWIRRLRAKRRTAK